MQRILQKIFLSILLFSCLATRAQLKFSASASPAEIGKNEYTQLKLMVENADAVQQIVPPSLKNFTIISGPNQENGMTMINGAVKKYIALTFILKPNAIGDFVIPPAMAKADGRELSSNPVSIKVTANGSNNSNTNPNNLPMPFSGLDPFAEPAPRSSYNDYILRKGENPLEKINRNMFVRAEVDKKSCYVGEPVVATFKLYTRLKSESNMIKNPSFNGFSVIDLQQPNDMNYQVEKFEGREYNVYTIRKAQLYPLLPGNLELGIAQIENNVHFIKADYVNRQQNVFDDMFRDFADASIPPEGMEDQKVTLQNKPISILVKPLPDEGKPAGFKGAVGNFEIKSIVEKNTFSTDDAGRLAIAITGSGNLQMINAPEIKWPDGMEGFDPKAVDDFNKINVPVSGRKVFEFPFTVASAGDYTIPAVTFSFFDAREEKYKTVSTKPIDVTVTKGTGKPAKINDEGIAKPTDNFIARFFSNRLRVVSVIAVLVIICLIVWLKKDTQKEKALQKEMKRKQLVAAEKEPVEEIIESQQNPLSEAEACLHGEDGKAFYIALNEGLKKYLAKKFSISPEQLNKKNITEQVDRKGIANETAVQLYSLIDEMEFELYTPYSQTGKMKEMYERANEVIQLLNTYHG